MYYVCAAWGGIVSDHSVEQCQLLRGWVILDGGE